MSNTKLTILAVIAAGMLAWAVSISTVSEKQAGDIAEPQYLIGNIEPKLINSIVLGAGDETVTLRRAAKGFEVKNKDGYPADTSEINELIRSCIDIKIAEVITDDAANHADLGVTEDSARSVVKFFKADDSLLTGVIIGTTKEGGQGTYIRRPGEDTVYLTLDNPWIRMGAMDYINQELVPSISESDIEAVSVKLPEETYTLTSDQDGNISLDKLPEGRTLKTSQANDVFKALSNLRFNDVSRDKQDLNFDRTYTCTKKDEMVYTIRLAEKDDKWFAVCSAEFAGALPTKSMKIESQDELKAKEAKLLANDNAKKFTDKTAGWVFEIASYSAEKMVKTVEELLEELPEPEKSEEAEAAAPEMEKTPQ